MNDTAAHPLKLFNSLTRQMEEFVPVHAGEARVYTCGPTVYNYPHIGNMRAYVFADLLGRTLSWKGYKLTHVINITDVGHLTDDADAGEDKLEKMAAEKAQSIWEIAKHYTEAYWQDIKALNIRQPAHWSIATDYVPAMIEYAKGIAEKHCYELDSGLYFDVSTVANYGTLARASTDDGEGRIETVEGKRNAADFAIWRKTPPGEKRQMEWDSPWGKGAPGWHLECSVMSEALLGLPFDIHTGGIDHREIHHPNEIAQNQAHSCSDHSGAKIWMHNNFLIDRTGKMSKSSGEFLRVQLLIDKGFHPLAYRLMCLQAHYRSELEFSWDNLVAALTRLKRIVMGVERLREKADGQTATIEHPALLQLRDKFDAALSEDLNSSKGLPLLEELLGLKKIPADQRLALLTEMDSVLGLQLSSLTRSELRVRPADASIDESSIEAKLDQRQQAKAEKDFATADAIRDELTAKGVELMDGDPLRWDWKIEI
ncbi:cysteine--tRNA ligase [Sphingorhabdus sp. M41]|uniref:cysteine--tRNA ligase n=1 Tax=Sphingorhabdus sp. M41 TaxID=1806885 RepID=UPI00078CF033|nr:cysteine--tRNA ligase [Sphingorhabdus sp. M41]AMO72316.1 cysteine--tRNA ligase [Sphingorhabdus sp. M41]